MKKALFSMLLLSAALIGCKSAEPVVKEQVVYNYVDSTIYHDSTIYTYIPKEVVKEVVPIYDTLKMHTSVADASAYVDTNTHTLKGTISNNEDSIPVRILYKERIVTKDSIVTNEVEVPVEVIKTKTPAITWYLLAFSCLCLLYLGYKLYKRLKH